MITMEFDRRQLGAAQVSLERLSKAVTDLTPMNHDIGAYMVASSQRRFERQAGPDGAPWIPSIRVRTEGGKTLLLSTRLFNSIDYRAASDQVEVGTNAIYAGVHQFGATIHAKNVKNLKFRIANRWVSKPSVSIPARPFLGIDSEDIAEIDDLAKRRLAEATGSAA